MKVSDRKTTLDPGIAGPGAVRPGDPGVSGPTDQVSVSESARRLIRLRAEIGDPQAVRTERVASLQAVIAKGRYSVDLKDVAQKVLRDLLGDLAG